MLKFGGHLTGANTLYYLSVNTDNMLIGRFINADALGLYTKAYQLFTLPVSQIRGPLVQVAMPVLSSLKNEPVRYALYYKRIIDVMASLTVPLAVYCAIEANFLISFFLGSKWLGAVTVFRILALGGVFRTVAGTTGLVLMSCGLPQRYLYWSLIHTLVCITAFIVGVAYGIEGVAFAFAIASYALFFPSLFYCFSGTPVTVTLFMSALFPSLVASGGAAFVTLFVKYIWPSDSIAAHILCFGLFGMVNAFFFFSRKSNREISNIIFSRLRFN